ncbi:hypothetical protein KKG71_06575 [Patescibacteria group bacterium]|nr:hypothetical protein [Patescibacteria group bacterium]
MERKLTQAKLIQGETLRINLIRISPHALPNELDFCYGHIIAKETLKKTEQQQPEARWLADAKTHWKGQSKWRDFVLPVAAAILTPSFVQQAVISLHGIV